MRSSKNRSRSKGNRNRSVGNIVNRVFDSSGPEGKVRGTPQQIIDKYNQLARDAQLGNDRVAAENFQQHAEHYLRMLAEAQKEQEARQPYAPQQGGMSRDRGGDGGDERPDAQGDGQAAQSQAAVAQSGSEQGTPRHEGEAARPGDGRNDARGEKRGEFDAVIDARPEGEGGLVATPESAAKPKRSRSRRPKKAADQAQGDAGNGSDAGGETSDNSPQEAAE